MVQTLILWLNAASAPALALPRPRTIMPAVHALRHWSVRHWEWFLIAAILLIAALAHGINMFHYPYFEDDEGSYVSYAWAVVHMGQLENYTYWYEHAPAGWIQIAVWTIVTGGFHTFGTSIESGRVLMLLMQVGSTWMLYRIARRISKRVAVATLVCLLFALSPYGIYYHRRVLLDNIATFWMLLSILLLLSKRLSLKRIWLSATALAISILSKEITISLVPVLMYLVFFRADRSHRWFAVVGWTAIVTSIVSLYVLLAILKGELFPTGTLLGGTAPHVSLLGTLQWQASRVKDGGILNFHSQFWVNTKEWATKDDPMLVVIGSLCAVISVLVMKRNRLAGILGAASLSLWAFLARGGVTIHFYLIPMLPLLALNLGLVFGLVADRLKSYLKSALSSPGLAVGRTLQIILIALCMTGFSMSYFTPKEISPEIFQFQSDSTLLWTGSQADAQIQAIAWVRKHVPLDSRIVIDEYMWVELQDSPNVRDVYRYAHYYWKVDTDPAILVNVFHCDWRNVDYVVTTPQLLADTQTGHLSVVAGALAHSRLLAHFDTGGWSVDVRQVINKGKVKEGSACSPSDARPIS